MVSIEVDTTDFFFDLPELKINTARYFEWMNSAREFSDEQRFYDNPNLGAQDSMDQGYLRSPMLPFTDEINDQFHLDIHHYNNSRPLAQYVQLLQVFGMEPHFDYKRTCVINLNLRGAENYNTYFEKNGHHFLCPYSDCPTVINTQIMHRVDRLKPDAPPKLMIGIAIDMAYQKFWNLYRRGLLRVGM